MQRHLATIAAAVLAAGCTGSPGGGGAEPPPSPTGGNAEATWLWEIGQGPAQTAKTCGRGANDPIARALCQTPPPILTGLADLYRVLRLQEFVSERLRAATTHSLGLGGRVVSALNPRTFVFRSYAQGAERQLTADQIDAAAFSRGEQFVELIGFDPGKGDFNLYLLSFQQACNSTRCTPADLLTSNIEHDWTGWTLYADRDLEDTALDCLSCHRPDGESAPKRLLMRQMSNPWLHWSDFHGVSPFTCNPAEIPADELDVDNAMEIPGQGLAALTTLEGQLGQYGGVPVSDLTSAASGHDFESFQRLAVKAIVDPDGQGFPDPTLTVGEPHPFDSSRILCERMLRPANPTAAWSQYRQALVTRGFPAPYHSLDVLDPAKRANALLSFPGFLETNAAADAFDLAAGLMSDDAQRAVGFVPAETDPPEAVLRQMCVRCHNAATPSRLRRARFNAEALDGLSAETIEEIRRRISLPRTSPQLMPPRRAGELPASVIQQLDVFLRDR